MEIHLDQSALQKLADGIAAHAEIVLNAAIEDARGKPLDVALNLVHSRLVDADIEPNDEVLRGKLQDLGFV